MREYKRQVAISIVIVTLIVLICEKIEVYANTYLYDALGRVTSVEYEDGTIERYTYDAGQQAICRSKIIPFGCFVAGTKVQTAEGEKNIEDIKVGEKVYAYDVENEECTEREVKQTYVHDVSDLVHLTIESDQGTTDIDTTLIHPFYVIGDGFLPAAELKVGDKLLLMDQSTAIVAGIQVEHLQEAVTVYNFEVDELHDYFVSDIGVLVHNAKCKKAGEGGSDAVSWSNHGYKHFPNKNQSWKDIVKSTKSGPAKYSFDIQDIEVFERAAWESGTPVTNGKNWRVNKFDTTIGAVNGKETVYVRIENSSNTIHGHPISETEYDKLLKEH